MVNLDGILSQNTFSGSSVGQPFLELFCLLGFYMMGKTSLMSLADNFFELELVFPLALKTINSVADKNNSQVNVM